VSRSSILLVLITLLSTGCGLQDRGNLSGTGSSFVEPVLKEWTSEYQKAKGVKLTYEAVGSRAGVERLSPGIFDFACTDAPLTDEQLTKLRQQGGEVIQVPLILGAVVPAYHLDEVKEPLTFTGPVLASIYLGKIKKWNDPALQEVNPGVTLPDKDILPVHRSDGSGTTYIWTDYLVRVSPDWKSVGVGSSVTWPTGPGEPGTTGVVKKIKSTPGSIGYVPLSYAQHDQLTFGAVKNRDGVAIKATPASVTAAAKAALKAIPEDMRFSLADAPGKDSYPISGTTWVVYFSKPSGSQSVALSEFLQWATHDGQAFAAKENYAPLPPELVERVDQKLATLKR
jgi:phosphate transport system substrate-binding protein